jgi:23S rRNA (cytosine1962-C5)-methyltransferase
MALDRARDSGPVPTPFRNRLAKNARHFRRWAERQQLTAYRVYDRDIPDFPYVVERYADRIHLVEYPRRAQRGEGGDALRAAILQDVVEVLAAPPERVFLKTHLPKPWGRSQVARLGTHTEDFVVEEQGLRFWVNLANRLDTGLFLDHRLTRARVRDQARGTRFLNLFAYTGAFTVYAAAGGARHTTSVDLSNTYLDLMARNLALNGLQESPHTLVRADALGWLSEAAQGDARWDLAVLDPPPFSTSKGMRGTFDVQRDHLRILRDALAILAPGGMLYFSTNYRRFQLDPRAAALGTLRELTPGLLPPDVQRKDAQRCWQVQHAPSGVREGDAPRNPTSPRRRPAPRRPA